MTVLLRLLPYLLAAAGIMGAYWLAYTNGREACKAEHDAATIAHITRAIEQANDQRAQDLEIIDAAQASEIKTRTVFRTIYREAEHVESDCADVGDEFVRVFNAAVRAADDPAATAGELHGAVPAVPDGD